MTLPDYLVSARLRRTVDPTDLVIDVVHRVRIDDEILHVISYKPRRNVNVCRVLRGREGTTAAEHSAGATVEAAP